VDRALRAKRDGDPSMEGPLVSVLRAGVLVDLAAQSMRQEPSDSSAPDRYRVAVLVRAGEATVPEEAACDAVAYRVTLGAEGEVLDVGRQTKQWPTAIRRAITIRDGKCTFPGCDRPPSWADVHHRIPWEEGGDTSVDDGALLRLSRSDGTIYTIERWQTHPLGCHRRRIPDRDCFEGILVRLVTGCSWDVVGRLGKGGDTTLRRRRDEWVHAGGPSHISQHRQGGQEQLSQARDRVGTASRHQWHRRCCQATSPARETSRSPHHRMRRTRGGTCPTELVEDLA
jgi:hypothetical protein